MCRCCGGCVGAVVGGYVCVGIVVEWLCVGVWLSLVSGRDESELCDDKGRGILSCW